MGKICVLSQETINQIAAGEVIERPFSVVKELVENALDAGATAVTVEIKEGGISFLRVTDNGSGFLKEDIPLAFLRHSTSKIRSVEDLMNVASLGFRGEALSSVAAVSQVELITCGAGQAVGCRYRIEGGKEIAMEEVGAPEGTTLIVRNLFFNTPVRRKFLKTPATEGSYISELMERMALSHPDVSLRLLINGQMKLHTAGNHNLKDIVYSIFGREITANLIPVKNQNPFLSVNGFIGKPLIARGNRIYEIYFINGRYIKSHIIQKAIEDGYKSFLMQHKYPLTVLHFQIDPEYLDVNVHPTKMELRFRGEQEIYEFLANTVRNALMGNELIPKVEFGNTEREKPVPEQKNKTQETQKPGSLWMPPVKQKEINRDSQKEKESAIQKKHPIPEPFEKNRLQAEAKKREEQRTARISEGEIQREVPFTREIQPEKKRLEENRPEEKKPEEKRTGEKTPAASLQSDSKDSVIRERSDYQAKMPSQADGEYVQQTLFEEARLKPEKRAEFRLIGQLFETYWLMQVDKEFLIIDQHAAHEKVLYERTMKRLERETVPGQQIAPPLVLSLSPLEIEAVSKNMALFERMGFTMEPFGGREYAVYSVPDHLYGIADQELLLQMIDELTQNAGKTGDMLAERVASASCKAAVKGRKRMSFAEAEHLLTELLTLDNPYTCPHGRPTIISMSRYELEKKFKRVL